MALGARNGNRKVLPSFLLTAIALLLVVVGPTTADSDIVWIQFDSEMNYRANDADPGIGLTWTAESFDDASWAETFTESTRRCCSASPGPGGEVMTASSIPRKEA